MNKRNFYITTTAPYVNADPHIGFALEILQADAVARFKKQLGYEVACGYGADEHGVKIYRKALEAKKDPQLYCDEYAQKFTALNKALNLNITHFIRTTDPQHIRAAQEFWKLCFNNGDIYKKNYQIKYCVGCELEKTDSELVDGRCPVHPNLTVENYKEENYFFRFSKYQKPLLDFYTQNSEFILPDFRQKEMTTFVEKGLTDFSISRLKSKMPWGVDVPNDPEHVMYVWFDALVFYISTIGWPDNKPEYEKWWPVIQIAGKDNLRQQSAIWQAMLMSAKLPNSKQIIIHGFITSGGQKMSKSLGNVVDPFSLIKKYGVDAVRYYLLKEIPAFDDGDYSDSRMKEIYNSDLANELGNLVSRITTLSEKDGIVMPNQKVGTEIYDKETIELYDSIQFFSIFENIWSEVKILNKEVNSFEPWNKKPEERKEFLQKTLRSIYLIGYKLQPLLPETAEKILSATIGEISKIPSLFPRLQ